MRTAGSLCSSGFHHLPRYYGPAEDAAEEQPKFTFKHKKGDKVKITEGMFENYEGEVDAVDMSNGRVTVMINIFGRSVPVELEHGQLEEV